MTRTRIEGRRPAGAATGREEVAGGGPPRRSFVVTASAVAAALVAAVVVAGFLTGGDPAPQGSATLTPGGVRPASVGAEPAAPSSPASGPAAEVKLTGIPVYWVAESMGRPRLYREFRDVPQVDSAIASAVAFMTRGEPLDPDYSTPWRPATRISASQDGDALTVDLSADAFSGTQVGSELAQRAVQQLIYTATAAAATTGTPASSVRITVDGAGYDAWGAVRLGEPMQRAPMSEVQAHSWVTAPSQGGTVSTGRVTFTGFGTSFEANFPWTIRTTSGTTVAEGYATSASGQEFGEFSFSADLVAGTYIVQASTDDASGGAEGFGAATDDKAFTVS